MPQSHVLASFFSCISRLDMSVEDFSPESCCCSKSFLRQESVSVVLLMLSSRRQPSRASRTVPPADLIASMDLRHGACEEALTE